MKDVYCIGELLIDFIAENQGKDLSKAKEFSKKPGGAPANVACAIAKLGGSSKFIGSVGDDPFGHFLLNILKENNVDISLAQKVRTFTTLAFVSNDENGERDFVFSRGADKELEYKSDVKMNFTNNIIHLGAATALLGGKLEKTYGHYFFDGLTQNTFISFDPNFRADLWRDEEDIFIKKCMPFIEKADLCKFSLEEAQLLSGKENLNEACEYLHELGAKIITVTLGSEGTLVRTNNHKITMPSIEVKPIDTTGAGDAFIGCLLFQIATLKDPHEILTDFELLKEMVGKANKAGAYTTTGYGAISSLPEANMIFD